MSHSGYISRSGWKSNGSQGLFNAKIMQKKINTTIIWHVDYECKNGGWKLNGLQRLLSTKMMQIKIYTTTI